MSLELRERVSRYSVFTSYSVRFVTSVEPTTGPSLAPLILYVTSIVASSGMVLLTP